MVLLLELSSGVLQDFTSMTFGTMIPERYTILQAWHDFWNYDSGALHDFTSVALFF